MQSFYPEILLVQDDILFITNKELTKYLDQKLTQSEIISYEFPTLWELHTDKNGNRQLLLHIELKNDLISIIFATEYIEYVKENQDCIQILGILKDFNIDTGEARGVIFITDINEGLHIILNEL